MEYLQIKGWREMQHYKDRDPKWIKLDREILNNYEFTRLSDEAKYHVIALRLLVAQTTNKIPKDPKWIAQRVSATSPIDLDLLVESGFLEPYNGMEDCVQIRTDSYTEKRREEESKEEKRIFTINDVFNKAPIVGYTDEQCQLYFDQRNRVGWLDGAGREIKDLVSDMRYWKNNGYLNRKPDAPETAVEKANRMKAEREKNKKSIMDIVGEVE